MNTSRLTALCALMVVIAHDPLPAQDAGADESTFEIREATIAEIHSAFRSGALTVRQLVQMYLDRIEQYDKPLDLNAFVVLNPRALDRADELDRELAETGRLRPMHGIPVVVKDNYDTHDLQTAAGSAALEGSLPPDDCFIVQKMREAGAIVLGKSNMAEWAFSPVVTISSILGTTRNPYDLSRVPAGSSGGTAAAVAANLGVIGLGTDTGNSIRGPSSHCALVGIRPTIGLTSRDGIVPLYLGQDVGGPMGRTVADAALFLQVIAGEDRQGDPVTALSAGRIPESYTQFLDEDGLRGARIGVLRAYFETETTDPEIAELMEQAIKDLDRLGAEIVDPFVQPPRARRGRGRGGRRNNFRYDLNNYLATLGPDAPVKNLTDVVESGKFHPSVERSLRRWIDSPLPGPDEAPLPGVEGNPAREAFREAVIAAMDEQRLDAIVYPTWSNAPREIGDLQSPGGDNSQVLSPQTGMPCMTVPMGYTHGNLPAGLSILGRPFDEGRIIRLGYAYEQGTKHRRPPDGFGGPRPPREPEPVARFDFDGDADNETARSVNTRLEGSVSFVTGLDGRALSLKSTGPSTAVLTIDREELPFSRGEDFSLRFWIRTTASAERRMVVLSNKEFEDNSLASQKNAGWVFYISDGTWAWNIGSDGRRLTYERDNGEHMPVNDGRWHQLAMTFDSSLSQVRLFYDGQNKVVYNVGDSDGFDFANDNPLVVGWNSPQVRPEPDIVPAIPAGVLKLQELVDAFNSFGLKQVQPDEFVHLIVDPQRLYRQKAQAVASAREVSFEHISEIESGLMQNPYTIHQAVSFMEAAPAMKIYELVDGRVTIRPDPARKYSERERLYPTDFDMDELAIFDRVLSAGEVLDSYAAFFKPVVSVLPEVTTSITTASWNIFHGGKHFTIDEHGWDSRVAIAEILKRENADVIMMQETYSSGDFIAAELGYHFATTVDWDYLNQGANISVLSRYPIVDVYVEGDSTFMNVGTKLAISETQELYASSNWYGMQQFSAVMDFHASRFVETDTIPMVHAGDFNAVPHTDGTDSEHSRTLLDAGFTDAYRSLYPDAQRFPGASHRSGRRIDQLYYKGSGLRNTSTRVVTTWPTGFPSDHYLILSTFDLDH